MDEITFFTEINVYLKTKNPAILALFGYNPYNFQQQHFPILITEFMANGSLDSILNKECHALAPHEFSTKKKNTLFY